MPIHSLSLTVPTIIVVALLLAYHALPALGLYWTYRIPEDICVAPFQPGATSFPPHVARYFGKVDESLIRLGFRPLGGIALTDPMPRVKAITVLYVHPTHDDSALVSVIYGILDENEQANSGAHEPLQMRYVEFFSRFDDETVRQILTNNSDNAGSFPPRPSDLTFRFPHVSDIEHLYHLHERLVERHSPSSRKIVRALKEFHGDLAKYLHSVLVETYRTQEQTGYLIYDAANRRWRPTFRGAGLMMWRELPPWKQLRALRVQKLGLHLERELG